MVRVSVVLYFWLVTAVSKDRVKVYQSQINKISSVDCAHRPEDVHTAATNRNHPLHRMLVLHRVEKDNME